VLDDIRRALAGIGESAEGKPLVSQPSTLALFTGPLNSAAPKSDVHVEATGSTASRGFVVTCGAWFAGTLPSRFSDDDSLARRARARLLLLHRLVGGPAPEDEPDDLDDIPPQVDDDGFAPTGDDDEHEDEQTEPIPGVEDEVDARRRRRS